MGQRAADAKRKAPGAERRGTEEHGPLIDPMRPALRLPQATRAQASGRVYAAVLPAGEGPRGGPGPNGLTRAFLTSHENIFADIHSVAYVVAPIRLARSEG